MKPLALIAALVLVAPATAAEPTFGRGFADTVIRYTGPATELAEVPVTLITLGDFDIVLEKTEMTAVAAEFGGTVHHQGEAGEAVTWICYTRGDRTFWFYSDGEMGGGRVNMVAVEDMPGASAGAGCTNAPVAFDSIDFGIRTFGDWMSVMQTFGKVAPEDGLFGYYHSAETPLAGGGTEYLRQELVYRLQRDHITAVAVLQLSEN